MRLMGLALVLALSGCDRIDLSSGNASANDTASIDGRPRPGTYDVTIRSEVLGDPDPGSSTTDTDSFRLTPAMVTSDDWVRQSVELDRCHADAIRIDDGNIDAQLQCDHPDNAGEQVSMGFRGTYDAESWHLTGDTTHDGFTQRVSFEFKRSGD